jgi:hypothetical protein
MKIDVKLQYQQNLNHTSRHRNTQKSTDPTPGVPPFHRPALRRCSKDFTVFPGSVEAGGAWILLVGRNSMR